MRSLLVALALVLSCLGCEKKAPRCDYGYTPPETFPTPLGAQLDAVLASNLAAAGAPGATLTVRIPSLGTWVSTHGVRSIETMAPIEPLDRFRVGSITKGFTTATMLSLAEEGLVDLDDRANAWVPAFGLPDGITIERLLLHTAGVFNFTDDFAFLQVITMPWTPDMIIDWALDESQSDHGYVFAPGTDFAYSNTGYLIAGRIIEESTGRPYHEVVRERTIARAGLANTGIDGFDPPSCGYVDGHLVQASVVTGDMEPAWTWAAGGLVSTGYDLCEWATQLYLGDILPEADRARMLALEPLSAFGQMEGYGMGTRHAVRGGLPVIGHTGSTMGFHAELFVHLPSGVCVAVLTNDFFARPSVIAQPAWSLLDVYTSP